MDSTLYWLWLAEALGSGCRLAGRLLEEYPDPAELYGQVKAGRNLPEYLSARAREFMQAVAPAQMAGLKKRCDDLNIFILTPDSADYPQRLRDLPDLPLVLYGTGNPACLNGRRYVGMVGTRRPTKYGLSACRDLSLTMAERGVVIVSGLAEGLDGAGHRAAVEAGQRGGHGVPVAAGGGKASEYFKSGTKGWDYHQYLMLFLMLTPTEKKIIRMTQLIENNVWLMKGYENFQLKNCAVKASFSGKIDVTPFFWKYPQKIQYRFHTEYAY